MLDQLTFHHLAATKGGDILDRQHIEINHEHRDLWVAIIGGGGFDQIIACSNKLIATTLVHFKSEENAMDANTLRNFTAHKRLHADMIESLKDISDDLERRRINGAMALLKFFDGRLTYHFAVEDAGLERELRS
jgi:hemerythrin-like metal-binding protein